MKVLVVDDHAIVRRGVVSLLTGALPDAEVGEAGTVAEARAMVVSTRWDLVLLDISVGPDSGIELLDELKQLAPRTPVLMVSAHREEEFAVRCLRQGALGYVSKSASSEELLAAVRKVASGGRYVTPALAERLASFVGDAGSMAPHEALSTRELQVLQAVARGRSLKQIADELGLSEKTIGTYRARISAKLGVSTNVELTRYALTHKLVE